jgi:hypothetical protein
MSKAKRSGIKDV